MSQQQTDVRLIKLINTITVCVSIAVGVALPGLYFLTKFNHQHGEVAAFAHIHGSLVTNAINKNPHMWRFEEHKLMALMADFSNTEHGGVTHNKYNSVHSLLNLDRSAILRNDEAVLPWPVLSHEVTLYDATKPVAFYRVEQTMRGMMIETLFVAGFGMLLALLIAIPLRTLPLRALRQSQQRLVHMAHHDILTGLPNRALLDDRLNQAILYARRYERQVTLVFIDLDNFKTINDSLGHDIGDELLKETAERMKQTVRQTDTVVRLGGDEFVIILFDQPEKAESITNTLQKVRDVIAQPLAIGSHTLRVTCSMGLATYPEDGEDVTTLLKNADAAMYQAKALGRNNFQFYTPEMNSKLQERVFLQQGMLDALAKNEFVLLYQPQVHIQTGQIIGVETLIRWQHPELGLIPPLRFIPLAEETGMIVQIGEWVLRTACKQNKAWQALGMPPIKMSVNVSPRQFKEKNWALIVSSALQESGLEAKYLELEITESLIMENVERAIAVMNELQEMGVQLSIDDFGTGYSSLSSLKHFPVARIKIDQSFIRSLPGNDEDQSIAMAVIALGHKLKLKVVAEGVETEQQRAFLYENECDEMQGYHFSKPVPAASIEQMFVKTIRS
ncbi:putative bifunctional diguanylate cyclase/phosphodiesterase [Massilia jejuensis]|uniref:Bifunctional diguanylate cyclase/phosphodiesterase n=1 Tax=Massilia jejuensis TaxID=648894 RepID=A0ABW0PPD6_9BURK